MDSSLGHHVECLICKSPPQTASLCKHCKKVFCLKHIQEAIRRSRKCPHCGQGITASQLIHVPWIDDLAEKLVKEEEDAEDIGPIISLRIQTLAGSTFILRNVNKNTASVLDLKNRIYEHEGVRPHLQVLLFSGRQLDNRARLKDTRIVDGAVLQLLARSTGGAEFKALP